MDVVKKILKNKKYKKQVDRLSTEILKIIMEDHIRALEEAYKGVKQQEPERVNDIEYLEAMADEMQKLSRTVLSRRKEEIVKKIQRLNDRNDHA